MMMMMMMIIIIIIIIICGIFAISNNTNFTQPEFDCIRTYSERCPMS
jgi:amino acid transporter